MSPAEGDVVADGQTREVDISAVEKELGSLWKSAADPSTAVETAPVMRSCLMNLVVICGGQEEFQRAEAIVVQVTKASPARVLMAVSDTASTSDTLTASITAHCSYTPGAARGRQICCEQITLRAGGKSIARLPGSVVALLLAELPVVVWWPGELHKPREAETRLLHACDRLLVDSQRFGDVAAQLTVLASMGHPVADLTWQRLRGWRELAAGLFDAPPFDVYPKRIEKIAVDYLGDGPPSAEAILLGSWAASRLGWKPAGTSSGPSQLMTRTSGEPADLTLRPMMQGRAASAAPLHRPGMVLSLTLQAPPAEFTLSRGAHAETLTASVTLPDACPVPRTVRVVERDETTLICRALESGWRDATYDDALQLAGRLVSPAQKEKTS